MNLLLAPATRRQIDILVTAQPHALRLVGPAGIGKTATAEQIAAKLLQVKPEKLAKSAYFKHVLPQDGKAIGIEQAREVTGFLNLKVPGEQAVNRVVLIEDAHLLTTEAQNALLKTLEEPPEGTVLILTAADDQALLPTIRSRSQIINLQKPAKTDTDSYFEAQGHTPQQISKAYAMSSGLPGLMQAILDDNDHPLLAAATTARQLLGQSGFNRLALTDELIKDRRLLEQTVAMLGTMAEISLQTTNNAAAKRWQVILKQSYLAEQRLKAKAQPKLVVDELLLNL